MSLIIADSDFPNLDGITRFELLKDIALETGIMQYGTATSGDNANLYDTNQLRSIAYSSADWNGGYLRIGKSTDNAAPESEISPIVNYEPELGHIEVSPPLTAGIAAGDIYELWKVNPRIVLDQINNALTTELFLPTWTVLSEIPDYDMEQSGIDYWTAGGTATVSKQSSKPRLFGKQYLRVVSSAAGDYAESVTVNLEPGRSYHVSVVSRVDTANGTGRLAVYNADTSEELFHIDITRKYPIRAVIDFLCPASCSSITVRLINVEASITTEWDEVCFFGTASSDVPMPWWLKSESQVKGIFSLRPTTIGSQSKLWDVSLLGEVDSRFDTVKDSMRGGFMARARTGQMTWPLFIYGLRNETAYADDNVDKKYIEPDLLTACIKYKIYEYFSQPLVAGLIDSSNFAAKLADAKDTYMTKSQALVSELNKTIRSTTPQGRYIDDRFTYGGL